MGSINYGTQIISFNYMEDAKGKDFNRLNYLVLNKGFYSGGSFVKDSDTLIDILPLVCVFEDNTNKVSARIETTTNATISVGAATPFIIARFVWTNAQSNYMDIIATDFASIQSDDLILGRLIFSGAVINGFDYSLKQWSSNYYAKTDNKYPPLFVYPTEPYSNKVQIYPGEAVVDGVYVTVPSVTQSPVISLPTSSNGRSDIIYLTASGTIIVDQGQDVAGAPTNVISNQYLPLAILHIPPLTTAISGSCIQYLNFYTPKFGYNIPINPIPFTKIAKPAAPITGVDYLYTKSDDNLYLERSDGNETPINNPRINGFTNTTTDNTLTFNNGTRTLTITPISSTYQIYLNGQVYNKTTDTFVIADTEGQHFIYYDPTTKVLTELVNPTSSQINTIITTYCFVAFIYWDAQSKLGLIVGKEQHGIVMDPIDHSYNHIYNRTKWRSGLGLNTMSVDGTGNLAANAQFGVDAGIIQDEDIVHDLSAIGSTIGLPIAYNSGTTPNLRYATVSGFSVVNTGSGRLAYNQLTVSGTWGLTEVTNNNFCLYHVFATNSIVNPIISVMGQADYATLANAQTGATTEMNILVTAFPAPEFKPLASIIFQTSNGYGNAVKARVRSTSTGANFVDWRSTSTTPGTVVGSSYTLPAATNSVLGGVIVASGLSVDVLGNLSTNLATSSTAGTSKPDGSTITISGGVISAKASSTGIQYLLNPDFESASQGITYWNLYNDGATPTPVDGTGGTVSGLTLNRNTTNPLYGTADMTIVRGTTVSGCLGLGWSTDFTIDPAVAGMPVTIQSTYKVTSSGSGYTDNDVGVYVYDTTNNLLIYPSVVNLPGGGGNVINYSSVFTASNSLTYRLIHHIQSATTSGWTMQMDDIYVGPQKVLQGGAIGPETAYTPIFTGFGTVTVSNFRFQRVGNKLKINGRFTSGTSTSVEARISIPAGLVIDATINTLEKCGSYSISANGAYDASVLMEPGLTYITLGLGTSGGAGLAKANAGQIITTNGIMSLFAEIPIAGWSSNINLATDFSEYASNSSATDADDTTSFAYGPSGSVGPIGVTNLTAARKKRIRFLKPVQANDLILIELYNAATGQWIAGDLNFAGSVLCSHFLNYNAVGGGMSWTPVNTTDFDITFFTKSDGATGWNAGSFAGCKWRVRKTSNGNLAEQPTKIFAKANATSQTVSQNNPIPFNTASDDASGSITLATGRFTCKIPGVYLISGQIVSNGTNPYWSLYKTGISYRILAQNSAGFDTPFSASIRLAVNDYIDVRPGLSGSNTISVLDIEILGPF